MTERRSGPEPGRQRLLYGRRRGRPLREAQRGRLGTLLPRLAVTLPDEGPLDPLALFDPPCSSAALEIGFGGGEHLAAQAAAQPDTGFIGCEVFENGIVKLLAEVERRSLGNIRILADDARLLVARLAPASLDRVFILFPDPWPKARHHKRRIVSTGMLDALAAAMREGGELRLATDDIGYLRWMLACAPVHPAFAWQVAGPADWQERPADWPPTRYEAKAIAAGRRPYFLRLVRRPRGEPV